MSERSMTQDPAFNPSELRVSVAEAIYGALWRSGDLSMPYEMARKYALEAIGGKGSEAQRRAIEWACAKFPPPDDIDVWQIDEAFKPPAPPSSEGQS